MAHWNGWVLLGMARSDWLAGNGWVLLGMAHSDWLAGYGWEWLTLIGYFDSLLSIVNSPISLFDSTFIRKLSFSS